jgi:hypothetical protein
MSRTINGFIRRILGRYIDVKHAVTTTGEGGMVVTNDGKLAGRGQEIASP